MCAKWRRTVGPNKRPRTRREYKDVAARLAGAFGPQHPVNKITVDDAQRFFNGLKPMNGKDELSVQTCDKILRTVKTLFNVGVKKEWIRHNPFSSVEMPENTEAPAKWREINRAEYHRLLDVAPTLRWKAAYALAYTAGLRFAEAFNLTWDRLDLDVGTVTIANRKATPEIPPFTVKKKASNRTIPLEPETLAILGRLKQQTPFKDRKLVLLTVRQFENLQKRWAKHTSKTWECQWVVNNVPREFSRHCRSAGIEAGPDEQLSFHVLRKNAGTNLARVAQNTKITREIMGHSSYQTTNKYYNAASEQDKKKTMDAIGDKLRGTDARTDAHRNQA